MSLVLNRTFCCSSDFFCLTLMLPIATVCVERSQLGCGNAICSLFQKLAGCVAFCCSRDFFGLISMLPIATVCIERSQLGCGNALYSLFKKLVCFWGMLDASFSCTRPLFRFPAAARGAYAQASFIAPWRVRTSEGNLSLDRKLIGSMTVHAFAVFSSYSTGKRLLILPLCASCILTL